MPAPFLDLTDPPDDAATRAATAVAALPAPPANNRAAESLWYEKVLAAHEAAGQPSTAKLELPGIGSISFDLGLGLGAIVLYGVLLLVASRFGPKKPDTDSVPVVSNEEAKASTEAPQVVAE